MMKRILQGWVLAGVLVTLVHGQDEAKPLLRNGDFGSPLAPWKLFSIKETPATDKEVGDGVLTIKAEGASDKPGNRQLMQEIPFETGKSYTLIFDLKGTLDAGKEIVVAVTTGPGKFAYFNRVPVGPEWTTTKLRIMPKETDGDQAAALKFLLGQVSGELSLRKVSLEEVE